MKLLVGARELLEAKAGEQGVLRAGWVPLTPDLSSGSLAPPSPATTSSSDSSKEEAEEKPPLHTSTWERDPTGRASGSGVSGVMMRRGTGTRELYSR